MRLLERFGAPRHLRLDPEAAFGGEHARRTGRSWWSLRYVNGDVVREWDRDRGSPSGHVDWARLAMLGRLKRVQALRLYCPNGQMAELGGEGDQTGRLFQLKIAVRHVSIGSTGTPAREVLGHVIGVITGYDGQCRLYAWEPLPEPSPPSGCPPEPNRPDYFNREQPAWALTEQHERYLSERAAFEAFMTAEPMHDWQRQLQQWEAAGRGRLVGPVDDNVYQISYQNVGRLNADVLGIADGEGR